jgi:hypothetical protein
MAVSLHKSSLIRAIDKDFKRFRFYSKNRQDIRISDYYALSHCTPSHYVDAQCAQIVTTC